MKKPKLQQFTHGAMTYTYELYLGGVKRINLRIRPDGSIRMSAPRFTSKREIDDFLMNYADKIAAAVSRAHRALPSDASALSKDEMANKKEQLLTIIRVCHQNVVLPHFAAISLSLTEQQRGFIAAPTAIRVRAMKSRWGSCNCGKGTLNFNLYLLDQPIECIEYVVMHEFAHFVHPDHSPAFHKLMDMLMPDWRIRKKKLNGKSLPDT